MDYLEEVLRAVMFHNKPKEWEDFSPDDWDSLRHLCENACTRTKERIRKEYYEEHRSLDLQLVNYYGLLHRLISLTARKEDIVLLKRERDEALRRVEELVGKEDEDDSRDEG